MCSLYTRGINPIPSFLLFSHGIESQGFLLNPLLIGIFFSFQCCHSPPPSSCCCRHLVGTIVWSDETTIVLVQTRWLQWIRDRDNWGFHAPTCAMFSFLLPLLLTVCGGLSDDFCSGDCPPSYLLIALRKGICSTRSPSLNYTPLSYDRLSQPLYICLSSISCVHSKICWWCLSPS